MGMGGAAADNPEDGVVGVDEEELGLFLGEGVFVVGEVVGDELGSMGHAQGLEAVGLAPMAQGEGEAHGVGIEEDGRGREMAQGEVGEGEGGDEASGDGGEHLGGLGHQGGYEKAATVEDGTMGGRGEDSPRLHGGKHGGDDGAIEAIGPQELEEELLGMGLGGKGQRDPHAPGTGDDIALAEGLEQRLVERLDGLEMGDGGGDGGIGSRLELAKEGEQLVAHLVAAIEEGGIGDVLDMEEAVARGIGLDVGPGEGQQGTHDVALDGEDAVEAGETGATEEVEEEGLGRVVAMVGGEDGSIAVAAEKPAEIGIAQPAGGILDGEMVAGGKALGGELGDMDGDTVLRGQGTDKALVAVAVARAEMEVAMGDGKGEAGRMHEMGEDDGVDSATNGKQHLLPRGEEVLLLNVGYETMKHYLMIILCIRRSPSNSTP